MGDWIFPARSAFSVDPTGHCERSGAISIEDCVRGGDCYGLSFAKTAGRNSGPASGRVPSQQDVLKSYISSTMAVMPATDR